MAVRLIVFTLAVLTLVNAYSFARLYSALSFSPPVHATHGKSKRFPASIQAPSAILMSDFKSRLALDLNCTAHQKMKNLKVSGQWAQLKGRLCEAQKLRLVEITNLNNGFTASVFPMGVQNYQTDLIQLVDGANKIRVRTTPVKGLVNEQTIIIQSNPI